MKYFRHFLLIVTVACGTQEPPSKEALTNWEEWKTERLTKLKSTWGYVNLAGLYWMEEGEHSFGSDSLNDIIFPEKAPAVIGKFRREGSKVYFTSNVEGVTVDSVENEEGLVFDRDADLTRYVQHGDLLWFALERSGKVGIRLIDLKHPKLEKPIKLEYFPYDPDLVVMADYRTYPFPRKVPMTDVLGLEYEMEIPGELTFSINGQSHSLQPIPSGDEFFIIFADGTSALETYGSGRYMYADVPSSGEKVILNFNKSYNPPCAFTEYATCLIPPEQNRLQTRIEAGELDFHF